MSRREIVADDLTGDDLTGQENTKFKITFDGKSGEVDLSDASRAALADFVAGNGPDALAKLLAAQEAPATTRKRSRTAKPGNTESATARTWARETPAGRQWVKAQGPDYKIPERGSARKLIAAMHAAESGNRPPAPALVPPASASKTA